MNRLGLYKHLGRHPAWVSEHLEHHFLHARISASIPDTTIRESAIIDGASHFTILLRIYTPLAKPILAVISIYTIVITWNSWFNALVHLPDTALQPLQLYLRRVLLENTVDLTKLPMNEVAEAVRRSLSNVQLKYAMIIFTTLPVLFAQHLLPKAFCKGHHGRLSEGLTLFIGRFRPRRLGSKYDGCHQTGGTTWKHLEKLTALFLAAALVTSMSACGGASSAPATGSRIRRGRRPAILTMLVPNNKNQYIKFRDEREGLPNLWQELKALFAQRP